LGVLFVVEAIKEQNLREISKLFSNHYDCFWMFNEKSKNCKKYIRNIDVIIKIKNADKPKNQKIFIEN
jgi:hypothetical protein